MARLCYTSVAYTILCIRWKVKVALFEVWSLQHRYNINYQRWLFFISSLCCTACVFSTVRSLNGKCLQRYHSPHKLEVIMGICWHQSKHNEVFDAAPTFWLTSPLVNWLGRTLFFFPSDYKFPRGCWCLGCKSWFHSLSFCFCICH